MIFLRASFAEDIDETSSAVMVSARDSFARSLRGRKAQGLLECKIGGYCSVKTTGARFGAYRKGAFLSAWAGPQIRRGHSPGSELIPLATMPQELSRCLRLSVPRGRLGPGATGRATVGPPGGCRRCPGVSLPAMPGHPSHAAHATIWPAPASESDRLRAASTSAAPGGHRDWH